MSLKDWLTKTIYVTSPQDPDPFFRPRSYSQPKTEVIQIVQEVIAKLPRWRVEEYKEIQGKIHASRATAFLPFIDDIDIYVVQGLDRITRLEMTGQTRVGSRDWGRNKRNLRQFLSALDQKLSPLSH